MGYVLDTSALIDAWTMWYPRENIPDVWLNIEDLAKQSGLTVPDAVLLELEAQADDLYKWCHARKDVLVSETSNEVQRIVQEISNLYKNLVDAGTPSKNFADPIVIAMAEHLGCAVVTHENASGNLTGPKMPDVCRDRGIRVIRFHRIVSEQGWRFQSA